MGLTASHTASVAWAKARRAVPTKAFREAPTSRYRRLKIEGGAFFYTLALADRGGDATESSRRFGE
jgi:hypothetical protein